MCTLTVFDGEGIRCVHNNLPLAIAEMRAEAYAEVGYGTCIDVPYHQTKGITL